ncbi:MAG: TonB-dependent receptor [Thermoanaerobaculia bacterium]|nr:TonB-dependent receptor [Thermoanaerobaculia bacterium]
MKPTAHFLVVLLSVTTLGLSAGAAAQNATGALYATVTDAEDAPLPGVAARLSGLGESLAQLSDGQGRVRFPGLEPGEWSFEASLDGFSTVEYPRVEIRAGRSTTLEVQMSPAVEDRITVSGQPPALDERKVAVGKILGREGIETVPNAYDPWSLLNQSPGVLVDRIAVGGSVSTQSAFAAPAVGFSENEWLTDGVEVTDQAGEGGNPSSYFDLDQFAQVEISTGGNEITKAKAGVSINLVTRRGTNELRGSARYLATEDDLLFFQQSSSGVDPGDFPPGQGQVSTDSVESIENYGFEIGGPILRDRLFFWTSYGENVSLERNIGGQEQETTVESVGAKLNAQVSAANSALVSWTTTDKRVPNRGGGPLRAPEALENQRGPSDLLKVEDTHLFSSRLFLSGSYSEVGGGFSLTPIACITAGSCAAAPEPLLNDDGVVEGSFRALSSQRPSEQLLLEGSAFFGARETSHEIKVGSRLREFEVETAEEIPGGRDLINFAGSNLGLPDGLGVFILQRSPAAPVVLEYTSLWIQDTVTRGRWTVNGGLRYDLQEGNNEPASVRANTAFPELLAALDFPGDETIDWESVSPRIGATVALGEDRQTLLRASFSRFAGALSTGVVERVNPVGISYATFLFADLDLDDRWAGPAEPVIQLVGFGGFDPADPTALETPNRNDPGLDPEITDEWILAVEHAVRPELVVGAHLTWRRRSDILEGRSFVRDLATGEERVAVATDFVPFTTVMVEQPGGGPFAVEYFRLVDGLSFTGGSLLTNGDREVEYQGLALTVAKRLSNGWMLDGYLNFGTPEWDVPPGFAAFDDPTRTGGDRDGELFGLSFVGFNQAQVIESGWSFSVTGLYEVASEKPWGFTVAGNVYGREGYPIPYVVSRPVPGSGRVRALAVEQLGDFRYDDVVTTDLRVEKELELRDDLSLTLSADLFNVFNEGYVLERNVDLGTRTANYVLGTLSPRIWRLGARLHWR